ncbi:hypothetical protein BDW22DRAFT_1351308 [Trametopsis cervina]|nr:hypothetical protein BDW22DRAFT_1351308 [Trametopsis cervina]
MTKPTLFQSILGRPSQVYHYPPAKEYHSTKHDLLRAATEPRSSDQQPIHTSSIASAPDSESGYFSSSSTGSQYSDARTPSDVASAARRSRTQRELEDVPYNKTIHTTRRQSQDRSLSKSIASSQAITDPHTDRTFTASSASTPPSSFYSHLTPKPSPLSSLRPSSLTDDKSARDTSRAGHSNHSSGSTSDASSEDEVFYTPRQSVYSSPRTSRTSAAMILDAKALAQALTNSTALKSLSRSSLRSKHDDDESTAGAGGSPDRASSESLLSITSTSSSSADGTVGSVRSASTHATTSTRITTPLTSDYGARQNGNVETITIARSHTRSHSTSSVPTVALSNTSASSQSTSRAQPRPLSATRRRSKTELRRASYTDEDWAKDVRWLAPAISTAPESPRQKTRPLSGYEFGVVTPASSNIPSSKPPPTTSRSYPPPAKSAEHRRRSRRSRGSRSSRGRMSALLEEDESEYSDITPTGSSTEPSRAPSPVLEEVQENPLQESPKRMTSPLGSTVSRSKSHRSNKEPSVSSSDEAAENPDARLRAYAYSQAQGQPRRSYSHTRRLSRSISPTVYSFSQNLPTHSIPTPTPLATGDPSAPHGYSGLTLPRAAYTSNGKADSGDGKIDLVRMGLAQSSMATVEVTRGVAEQNGGNDGRKKRRHFSFNLSLKIVGMGKKGKGSSTPAHLLDSLPLPVAFLSHVPPPSHVPSSHVLVQVFAVGLDALDSLLVQDKMGNGGKGAGYIPGRSIVGRVIECGWEVKNDVCKRGEWVIGLLDVRKCGALAEFVVLERHRVHRAPQPLSRPATLFPPQRRSHVRSKSLPSTMNAHPYAQLHRDLISSMNMTLEELALLPLCALPAHRAVRTCVDVIAPAKPRPGAEDPRSRKLRALVLQGHDGAGGLAVQMLARRGVQVSVQVPDSAARDDGNEDEDEDEPETAKKGAPNSVKRRSRQTRFDRLDARLRAWGAEELCVGDPLEVLERLVEDSRSFDVVLDTVGGVEIWETSRKLLLADPEHDTTRQYTNGDPGTPLSPSGTASSSGVSRASSRSNQKVPLALTQFTTLVGDSPTRAVPSAHDTLRSGFRSIKRSATSRSTSRGRSDSGTASPTKSSSASLALTSPSKDSLGSALRRGNSWRGRGRPTAPKRTVNYAWVSVGADVDFEGEDVRDSLAAVVKMVEDGWIRPWVGDGDGGAEGGDGKSVPFDKAPEVFRRGGEGPVGVLKDGGTCVVKIVA